MRQDYAKRPTYRKPDKPKKSNWLLRLITLVLFIAFTLTLVYLGKHHIFKLQNNKPVTKFTQEISLKKVAPKNFIAKKNSSKNNHKPKEINNNSAIDQTISPTPQFDFYTILPQKTVPIIVSQYEIEIKATDDLDEANNLKTKLSQLGIHANVVSTDIDGATRYLVNIGPFEKKSEAMMLQKKLNKNKIFSKIKKIK